MTVQSAGLQACSGQTAAGCTEIKGSKGLLRFSGRRKYLSHAAQLQICPTAAILQHTVPSCWHWGSGLLFWLLLRSTYLYWAQNRLCLQYSAADLDCGVTLANKLLHLISSYHHYRVHFSLLKLQLQWGTLNINVAIVSNSFICNIFIYTWRVTATIH